MAYYNDAALYGGWNAGDPLQTAMNVDPAFGDSLTRWQQDLGIDRRLFDLALETAYTVDTYLMTGNPKAAKEAVQLAGAGMDPKLKRKFQRMVQSIRRRAHTWGSKRTSEMKKALKAAAWQRAQAHRDVLKNIPWLGSDKYNAQGLQAGLYRDMYVTNPLGVRRSRSGNTRSSVFNTRYGSLLGDWERARRSASDLSDASPDAPTPLLS